jgi:hypothetical protein
LEEGDVFVGPELEGAAEAVYRGGFAAAGFDFAEA